MIEPSPTLIALLRYWEGFRAQSYDDGRQWSWGYGTKAPGEKRYVSEHRALADMMIYVENVSIPAYSSIFAPTQAQLMGRVRRDMCIAMIYQMGEGSSAKRTGFRSFVNMIRHLKQQDFEGAYHEALDSRWAREDPPVGTPERAAEVAKMLLLGQYELPEVK